jgi:hypothetical protein
LVKLDDDADCRFQQRARQHFDFRGPKQLGREKGLLPGEFVATHLLPEDIFAFSNEKLGCYQLRSLA